MGTLEYCWPSSGARRLPVEHYFGIRKMKPPSSPTFSWEAPTSQLTKPNTVPLLSTATAPPPRNTLSQPPATTPLPQPTKSLLLPTKSLQPHTRSPPLTPTEPPLPTPCLATGPPTTTGSR